MYIVFMGGEVQSDIGLLLLCIVAFPVASQASSWRQCNSPSTEGCAVETIRILTDT